MRKILALLLLIVAGWPTCAYARGNANFLTNPLNVPPSFFCPFGTGLGDGCPNPSDPTGANTLFSVPTFFTGYANTVAATTADYSSTRPQWNVACVDYKCGPYTPLASLQDITTMTLPAGCSVSTGSFGDPQVTCSSGGTISHWRGDGAGGHNGGKCVSLLLNGTTPYILDDFYIDATDPNCSVLTSMIFANSVGASLTATNFYLNGESPTWGCGSHVQQSIGARGTLDLSYFANLHFPGRPVNFVGSTASGYSRLRYYYVDDYTLCGYSGHGEWFLGGPQAPDNASTSISASYGLSIRSHTSAAQGQAPFFPADTGPFSMGAVTFDHNGTIIPNPGGGGKTVTGTWCVGADETCTTAGNTLFIRSMTAGTIGTGQNLQLACSKISGVGTTAYVQQQLTGPGGTTNPYLSSWSLDGALGTQAAPNLILDGNVCTASSMGVTSFTNGNQTWGAGVATGPTAINSNYGDWTMMANWPTTPTIWSVTNNGPSVTVAGSTVSGTTLTFPTSQTVTTGQKVTSNTGTGITGCTAAEGGVTGCPSIVTGGTGTSFTLSSSGGSFSGTVQVGTPSTCLGGATTFDGNNYDLAGAISSSYMNQFSFFGQFKWWTVGC